MVGPWPLAPDHDYLQYKYHVYLMQAGLKSGYYTNYAQTYSVGKRTNDATSMQSCRH